MAEQRVAEAKKLGFETVILPAVCMKAVDKIRGCLLYTSSNAAQLTQISFELPKRLIGSNTIDCMPVSYTHLDVYKRQV